MKFLCIGLALFLLYCLVYLAISGSLITVLGYLVLFILSWFFIMYVLSICVLFLRKKNEKNLEMPHLIPVVIPTKDLPYELHRLAALATTVRNWELAKAWKYKMNNGTTIVIPAEFVFDGASIPKPLWGILSPTGLLLIPGLIHDYAYRHDQLWKLDENGNVVEHLKGAGRKVWDDLFEEIGNEVNNFKVINCIATKAVWLCGGFAWDSHADSRKKNNAIKPVL